MPCDCNCIPKCCDNPEDCNGDKCKCKENKEEKTVDFEADFDLNTIH